MQYLDILIAFSAFMLLLAQTCTVITDFLNYAENKQGKEFEKFKQDLKKKLNQIETLYPESSGISQHIDSVISQHGNTRKKSLDAQALHKTALDLANGQASMQRLTLISQHTADLINQASDDSTNRYRNNARIKSIVSAIVVALALNLSVFNIFAWLAEDSQARELLIQQQISQLQTQRYTENEPLITSEIDRRIRMLSNEQAEIKSKWLPNMSQSRKEQICDPAWWLGCIITGLLAGLGAPFWRKMVYQLLQIKTSLNNRATPIEPQKPEPPATTTTSSQTPTSIRLSDGTFNAENIQLNPQNNNLMVDVRASETTRQLRTEEELKRDIQQQYQKYSNNQISNVTINNLEELRPYLFEQN